MGYSIIFQTKIVKLSDGRILHKTQRLEAATCWCAEESRHGSWIRFSSIYSMPDLLPFLLRSSVRYFIDFSETRIRFYGIILL